MIFDVQRFDVHRFNIADSSVTLEGNSRILLDDTLGYRQELPSILVNIPQLPLLSSREEEVWGGGSGGRGRDE